jgi:diguanylate cyclase (GGDEF) domain
MADRNYELDPKRLAALAEHEILDTLPEREYDDIVTLAALICDTPIAVIAFIDSERAWFKARKGIGFSELANHSSLCSHTPQMSEEVMTVQDLWWDAELSMHPLVVGEPHIRSYAAVPILTKDNHMIGSLCVADRVPREFSADQLSSLRSLANQLHQTLDLRRKSLQLERVNKDLRNLAVTDDLTGLFNRRGLAIHAEQQLKNFRSRTTDRGMWVMVADLDGLKEINDVYGHLEGSIAIRTAGELLSACVRGSDILGRPGGDEFIGILVNTLDEVALKLPDRIETAFNMHNLQSDKPYNIEISVGLVKVLREDVMDITEIVQAADKAMYAVKRRRKERVAIGNISGEIHLSADSIHVS